MERLSVFWVSRPTFPPAGQRRTVTTTDQSRPTSLKIPMTEDIPATATPGDRLALSAYLSTPVTVHSKAQTPDGPVLVVESTGGSRYRIRAVDDDDDRLLMEKAGEDGWNPHIRLDADLLTDD